MLDDAQASGAPTWQTLLVQAESASETKAKDLRSAAAEAWLREHDPCYAAERQAWKNIDHAGMYRIPRESNHSRGLAPSTDLTDWLDWGHARMLEPASGRCCDVCGTHFVPINWWQAYCRPACRQAGYRRRREMLARGPLRVTHSGKSRHLRARLRKWLSESETMAQGVRLNGNAISSSKRPVRSLSPAIGPG